MGWFCFVGREKRKKGSQADWFVRRGKRAMLRLYLAEKGEEALTALGKKGSEF